MSNQVMSCSILEYYTMLHSIATVAEMLPSCVISAVSSAIPEIPVSIAIPATGFGGIKDRAPCFFHCGTFIE